MRNKITQPWISSEAIEQIIRLEPLLALLGLAAGSYLVYRFFLRSISPSRHQTLRSLFRNLLLHSTAWLALFLVYVSIQAAAPEAAGTLARINTYIGLLTIVSGANVFVKTARILVFEYLFLGYRREGVPLLLVNLATLALSIVLAGWIATEIFGVRLAPLLATSAILSLVLGLALQDTLGNLFAGVAMQFDKPYEIGDWIEVTSGSSTWTGKVHEISWRATVLIGLGDELLTIPNRAMGQAEISNFTPQTGHFLRRLVFRVAPAEDPAKVKAALLRAARRVPGIKKFPAPLALVTETHESWLPYKLIYSIDDYGAQFVLADTIIDEVLLEFRKEGIALATNRLLVEARGYSSQTA
jgi:small-conductance mechanosensitive channel